MIKLKKVEIDKYKSFLEKQEIDIEDGVTRIVGKNESGKTALLEAMAKFNYFDSSDDTFKFNSTNEYPRGLLKKYQQEYPDDKFPVITGNPQSTIKIKSLIIKPTNPYSLLLAVK